MKTYRIIWSRLDNELGSEDRYYVIVSAKNKAMALASVRKYFSAERKLYGLRYVHFVISLEVEIGKGNRSAPYWRALDHHNIYLADYRIQSLAIDITSLVVPGLPDDIQG